MQEETTNNQINKPVSKGKIFLISTAVAITAFVGGTQIDNETKNASITPQSVVPIPLSLREVNDAGRTRYDIKVEDHTFHFWYKEGIQEFADRFDEDDDEFTRNVRSAIKNELITKTVDEFINDIKE